jgi:MazG family protein
MEAASAEHLFAEYMAIIHRLRKECPWDMKQTHESLRAPLIEEVYEVADAITELQSDQLRNELGDLLLHIALQTEIAAEENAFTMADVLRHSKEKMIRRHPHIFGDVEADDEHSVRRNWEEIKRQEGKTSILDGVPKELPALIKAQRTQEKASVVGFDWSMKSDVWNKVREELEELKEAELSSDKNLVEHEFGDLLFALVNYSRFIGVNAEFALRTSIDRFGRRFQYIEDVLKQRGKRPAESTLEEMDELWDEAKKQIG